MKETKDITCCIVDHGLFLPLAHRLAKDYKRVLYHTPWEDGFPTLNRCIIGDGYDDFERCDDIFDALPEIDLFVFPDLLHSGLQLHLESLGKPVWGGRKADSLELNREKFHRILGQVGLEVPEFETVIGLTKLREYLEDKENVFIKISKYRGSLETKKFRNMDLDRGLLDSLAVKFGCAQDLIPFLVFSELKTDLEIGGDTYFAGGSFPNLMLHGLEHKDQSYFAAVTERQDMPEHVQEVMDAFAPILAKQNASCQISMEIRVVDGKGYFIDPTIRGGLPSSNSQYALWKNLGDIIYHGAYGELVEPEPAAKFAIECILTTKGDRDGWIKVRVPDELRDWFHASNCCMIDGTVCFPPTDSKGNEIGWLNAIGDTMEETLDTIKEYAGMLPDGVDANTDALVDLLQEIKSEEKQGIEFTEQEIPEPETALNI